MSKMEKKTPHKLDTFPQFADGDVLIVLSDSQHCRLHSQVLANNSQLFRAMLSKGSAAKLTTKVTTRMEGFSALWRFHLEVTDPDDEDEDISLKRIPLGSDGYPLASGGFPARGAASRIGTGMPDPISEAYYAVLGAMYGKPIALGDFEHDSFKNMLETAYSIQRVADYLEVMPIVTKPMEADLLSHGATLFRSIGHSPAEWLQFACGINSRLIFKEAVIHCVGQYHRVHSTIQSTAPPAVYNLIKAKYTDLTLSLQHAQMSMLSYYPPALHRDLTVGLIDRDSIGRNSYQNDIFSWMALNAFRHWVSQNVVYCHTHKDEDMGYHFFRVVAEGGDAYLRHEDLEGFFRLFPMTAKGKAVLEGVVAHLKAHCRQFALPFIKNKTQLDIKEYPTGFLACATVNWEDFEAMGW